MFKLIVKAPDDTEVLDTYPSVKTIVHSKHIAISVFLFFLVLYERVTNSSDQ